MDLVKFVNGFKDHDSDDMLIYRRAGDGGDISLGDLRKAAQEYTQLKTASEAVENWWLEWLANGKQPFIGAPWAIFVTRMVLETVNAKK